MNKKKIFITIIIFSIICFNLVADITFPKPVDWVVDEANILSTSTKNTLKRYILELKQKTGVEFSVVTVKSLQDYPIEEYSIRLAENWKVGEKGIDNGLILLVAPNERRVRIEVGYGLEGIIPDGHAGEIIRKNIIPAFMRNDFNKGVLEGSLALLGRIANEKEIVLQGMPERYYPQHGQQGEMDLFSTIISLLVIGFLIVLFIRNPSLFLLFLMMSGGGRRGGRGGFGGSFGSGSFGGFGGGSFGGGGASGRW